jgi:hypothetical protein
MFPIPVLNYKSTVILCCDVRNAQLDTCLVTIPV